MQQMEDGLRAIKRRAMNAIGRFQYGQRSGYNAKHFWEDRLSRYGLGLRGVGNEGSSVQENTEEYVRAKDIFLTVCRQERIDFGNVSMLDIGCGNGFYADICRKQMVKQYLGVDITDALFGQLRAHYSGFQFKEMDVSTQELKGAFDLIIMIDVTQHITEEQKFSFAMENIKSHLRKHGVFIVTSWLDEKARESFYEISRSWQTYQQAFPGYIFSKPISFRDKYIFSIREPETHGK